MEESRDAVGDVDETFKSRVLSTSVRKILFRVEFGCANIPDVKLKLKRLTINKHIISLFLLFMELIFLMFLEISHFEIFIQLGSGHWQFSFVGIQPAPEILFNRIVPFTVNRSG